MNERFRELAKQADIWCDQNYGSSNNHYAYDLFWEEKFSELIYNDIITVVAAQALLNESALDVFKNLRRIYEGVE